MLTIGICEDNQIERQQLQDMVSHICFSREEIQIKTYSSGGEILRQIEEQQFDVNLLLLDIGIPEPDGISLAHELRQRRLDMDIIFITRSREHIFEGYKCKAFTYILKPCTMERLSEELNRYMDELEMTSECLNVNIQGNIQRVPLSEIYYIESDRRKILLHTQKQVVEFYEKMESMEALLRDKGFVRCHQSYMVQKRYVTAFGRSGIQLQNAQVPVSRRYYDELKQIFSSM